jgi:signal transduction histidine kinase
VETEVCKLLCTLRSSSQMLLDVINDVLDLSKIESGV